MVVAWKARHDLVLRSALDRHQVKPLLPPPRPSAAVVELGRALYFDKLLSGNKDVSCATCHHPRYALGDGLAMSVGTGGTGLGPERRKGDERRFVGRNAPALFNRGLSEAETLFWDGRVSGSAAHGFQAAGDVELPPGLDHLLAAQAVFPLLNRDEMRGHPQDVAVDGSPNELADIPSLHTGRLGVALLRRVLAVPEYRDMLRRAYPTVQADGFMFAHLLNALAAFQVEAATTLDTPFDRYLLGDSGALTPAQKQGAVLFFGEAGCAQCHSGSLLTDQRYHNLGVPTVSPQRADCMQCHDERHASRGPDQIPLGVDDTGRARVTLKDEDRYAFLTPPLRNVELTGPYMHNGAFSDLGTAVRHHLHPQKVQLGPDLAEATVTEVAAVAPASPALDDQEVELLLEFLHSLTDPRGRHPFDPPDSVPSGLEVER